MLPDTHLLQLLPLRINKALDRLKKQIWTKLDADLLISATRPSQERKRFKEGTKAKLSRITSFPHFWSPAFAQRWYRLDLPKLPDETVYLRWHDQGEATAYLDGEPWYGIDPGHKECPIPPGTRTLWLESICCNTGIWVPGHQKGLSERGSRHDGAELFTRNELAWELYHDLLVLAEWADLQSKSDQGRGLGSDFGYQAPWTNVTPALRRLIRQLSEAIDVLDSKGLPAMRAPLKAIYKDFKAEPQQLKAVLTGHAHIDLVWLWPERTAEFKATHTFATMLNLLNRYPEFRFGYSQPASYEAVARHDRKQLERVKEQIAAGKWEATGALYVESDTQLACGEALLRSMTLGQEGFRALRGTDSRVVWLPDVFGYAPCLPQIMKGCGVDYFFTQKLTWSNVNRFPYSSFRWRGHDGSEVLAYVMQAVGYNALSTIHELRECANTHQQADLHDEFLVPTGFGDGGGGTTEEMLERTRRTADLYQCPRSEWGSIEGFYERLESKRHKLPTWHGEMYLEFHRGVQTTHCNLKSTFREAERALQVLEAAHCVRNAGAINQEDWKRVVFAQFHDYIPGSSIIEVYEEGLPELKAISDRCEHQAAAKLSGKSDKKAYFNPLAIERSWILKKQKVSLPPLSGLSEEALLAKAESLPELEAREQSLRSDRVQLNLDKKGRIRSLKIDGHELPLKAPAATLYSFPDNPALFEAWDIDRSALALGTEELQTAVIKLDSSRAGEVALIVSRPVAESSQVRLRFALRAGEPFVRLTIDIDWQDREALLKLAIPTEYAGSHARYGTPFGSITRGQQAGRLDDEAAFEVPASRWAMVSDEGEREALYLVTKDRYGFGCYEGLLHLSLVRSAFISDSDVSAHLRKKRYTDDFSDLGKHTVELAIGRYEQGAPLVENPAALADTLFTDLLSYRGNACSTAFEGIEGSSSLLPCWAKPEGKAFTLRLHETLGQRGSARILLREGYQAVPTDLLGNATAKPLKRGQLDYKPYELISLRIEPV